MILFLVCLLPVLAVGFLLTAQTASAWGGGGWGAAASAMASSGGSGSYGGVSWGGGGGGGSWGGGGGGGGGSSGFGGYSGSGGGYWSSGGWVSGGGGGGPSATDIVWLIDNKFSGSATNAQAWIDGIYKVSNGYKEAWAATVSSTTPQSVDLAANLNKIIAQAGGAEKTGSTAAKSILATDMSQINDYLAALAGKSAGGTKTSGNLNGEANTKLVIQSVDWSKSQLKLSDSAKQSLLANKNLSQVILNAKDLSKSSIYTIDTSKINSDLNTLLKNAKIDTGTTYVLSAANLNKANANLQALIDKSTVLTGVGNKLYNLGIGKAVSAPTWTPSLAQQKMGVQGDSRFTDGDCMFNSAASEAWKLTGGMATFTKSGLNQEDSQILVAIMKSVAQPQWTPKQLYNGQVDKAEVKAYIDWAKQNQDVQILDKTTGSGGKVVNLLPKGTLAYESALKSAGQATQMAGSYESVAMSADLKGYISNNYNNIIGTDGVSCASNIHAWESTQPGSSVYYLKDIMIQSGWGNYISPQNVYDSGASRVGADGKPQNYYLGDTIIRDYNEAAGMTAATVTVSAGTTVNTARQSSYDKSAPGAATIQSILSNNPGMYYKQDLGFFNTNGVKDMTAGQADDVVSAVNRGVSVSREPGKDACDSLLIGSEVAAAQVQVNTATAEAANVNALREVSVSQTGTGHLTGGNTAATASAKSGSTAMKATSYTAVQTTLQQLATGSTGTIKLSGGSSPTVKNVGSAPAAVPNTGNSAKNANSETRLTIQSSESPTSAQATELLNQAANQLTIGINNGVNSFGNALEKSANKAALEAASGLRSAATGQNNQIANAAKNTEFVVQLSGSDFGSSIYNDQTLNYIGTAQTLPVNSKVQQSIATTNFKTQTVTGTGYTTGSNYNGSATGHTAGSNYVGEATGHTAGSNYNGPATGHTAGSNYNGEATGHTAGSSTGGSGTGHTAGGFAAAAGNAGSNAGTGASASGNTTSAASTLSPNTSTASTTSITKTLTVSNDTEATQSTVNAVLAVNTSSAARCQYKNDAGSLVDFDVTNGFNHNTKVTVPGKGGYNYEISCKLNGQEDVIGKALASVNVELPTARQSEDENACVELASNDRRDDNNRSYLNLPGGDTVYLWQSMEDGVRDEFQKTNWYAGYQFTTIKVGQINQLCGNFKDGIVNKVSLFNGSFAELATVDIVGNGTWKCVDIQPVRITADGRYYVIATLKDSPVSIEYQNGMLPKMVGNVTIEAGLRQVYNLSDRQPIVKYDHIVFGLVDARIDFAAGSDNGPIVTNPAPSSMVFSSNTMISVNTNADSACKFDRENVSYADMRYELRKTGKNKYGRLVCGLSPGPFTFYVKCRGQADGIANSYSAKIRFISSR